MQPSRMAFLLLFMFYAYSLIITLQVLVYPIQLNLIDISRYRK